MFARKLRVEVVDGAETRPAPKEWLDQFFMRNFIGLAAFDETLVTGDGELETGLGVSLEQVQAEFERWVRGRKLLPSDAHVKVRVATGIPACRTE